MEIAFYENHFPSLAIYRSRLPEHNKKIPTFGSGHLEVSV